jgi:hypothetical protein
MKVNHSLELDENRLREIRASFGRGGRATRAEVRIWLNRIITAAISDLPPAKVRACNTSRRKQLERETAAVLAPIDPATICVNCGATKSEHIGMMQRLCPVSKAVRAGMFKAATS